MRSNLLYYEGKIWFASQLRRFKAKSYSVQIRYDQHKFRIGDSSIGDPYSSIGRTSES